MINDRHMRELSDQDIEAITLELFLSQRRYRECAEQWERIGGAGSEPVVRNNRARAEECKRLARVIEGEELSK